MPLRLRVRAAIWVDDKLVVHATERQGKRHVTLPGGRVNERESVTSALQREVLEEVGLEIEVGDLLLAAEVFTGARHQDVELVFNASPEPGHLDPRALGRGAELIDPWSPEADQVLPPVLTELARRRVSPQALVSNWLGNLYVSQRPAA